METKQEPHVKVLYLTIHGSKPMAPVTLPSSQVIDELLRKYSSPKPTVTPKTKMKLRLTNTRFRKLAKKNNPLQSWFDNDEEGLY